MAAKKGNNMKSAIKMMGFALFLALVAGTVSTFAQTALVPPSSTVSYLNPGRYLIFQGSYVNEKGDAETGLMKFDSQTGLAWMLRPVPDPKPEIGLEFRWLPVKN